MQPKHSNQCVINMSIRDHPDVGMPVPWSLWVISKNKIIYLDPPVGVSWLDYPTLPIGFQTGHPDRRVLVYIYI